MKPSVTVYSQVDVLRSALALEGVTHGAEVLATLRSVSVDRGNRVFFCQSQVNVNRVLQEGDGGVLPDGVTVDDLKDLRPGNFVDIENVRISVNGRIAIIPTPQTRVNVVAG